MNHYWGDKKLSVKEISDSIAYYGLVCKLCHLQIDVRATNQS